MIRGSDRWIHLPTTFLTGAVTTFILASCSPTNSDAINGAVAVKQINVVGGYREKTFSEKYHLDITLPMPETAFLALLGRLKLPYDVCGERGTRVDLPAPRHPATVDLSRAEKCYEIYGEHRPDVGEGYRAFVDKAHQVVYIENAFAYTDL